MEKTVKIVCPTVEDLGKDVKTNILCPEQSCSKIFQTQPALKLHLIKTHKVIEDDEDLLLFRGKKINKNIDFHYHCPVEPCKYNKGTLKYFTKFNYLRQHFHKVHAEKKYSCPYCNQGFALVRLLKYHQTRCDLTFRCKQCCQTFDSMKLLETHCKDSNHPFHFTEDNMSSVSSSKSSEVTSNRVNNQKTHVLLNDPVRKDSSNHKLRETDSLTMSDCNIQPEQQAHIDSQTDHNLDTRTRTDLQSYTQVDLQPDAITSLDSTSLDQQNCSLKAKESLDINASTELMNTITSKDCNTDERDDPNIQAKANNKVAIINKNSNELFIEKICEQNEKKVLARKQPRLLPKVCTPSSMITLQQQSTTSDSLGGSAALCLQNIYIIAPPQQQPAAKTRKLRPLAPKSFQSSFEIYPNSNFEFSENNSTEILNVDSCDRNSLIDETVNSRESIEDSSFHEDFSCLNGKSNTATQTALKPREKFIKAAETQTSGDFILQHAMASAKLPIVKESKGSQVSPRAKLKSPNSFVYQSTQTGAIFSKPGTVSRKHVKKLDFNAACSGIDFSKVAETLSIDTNTNMKHAATQDTLISHNYSLSTTSNSQGTSMDNVVFLENVPEGIATQTEKSYLATTGVSPLSLVPTSATRTHNTEMQTKYTMNMSLQNCDSRDLFYLQQFGILETASSSNNALEVFDTGNNASLAGTELVSCSSRRKSRRKTSHKSKMVKNSQKIKNILESRPSAEGSSTVSTSQSLPVKQAHTSPIIAQADSAINLKIAEFEKNEGVDYNRCDPCFTMLSNMSQDSVESEVQTSSSALNSPLQLPENSITQTLLSTVQSLHTNAQTSTFDNPYNISTQTQTTDDDYFTDFWSHMETQTNDDLWENYMGLNSSQTQTSDLLYNNTTDLYSPEDLCTVNVESQTSFVCDMDLSEAAAASNNVGIQANTQFSPAYSTSDNMASDSPFSAAPNTESMDIQTQTLFDENLIDSHTQTSWKDLMKLIQE